MKILAKWVIFFKLLRVHSARIDMKIFIKKTKSLRLGIDEGEEVILC